MHGKADPAETDLTGLELSDIPGLGPVRRAALAEAGVEDLRGLLEMGLEELATVRGVGAWQARRIREFLRHRGLLVEETGLDSGLGMGQSAEDDTMVVRAPETPEEATLVAEAVRAIEQQAEVEAVLVAAVAEISEALEAQTEALQEETEARSEPFGAEAEPGSEEGAPEASPREPKAASAPRRHRHARRHSRSGSDKTAEQASAPPETVAGDRDSATEEKAAPEPGALSKQGSEEPETKAGPAEEGDATAPTAAEALQTEIRERRERLPDTTLELIEAIRQAAVSKQLTRQVTRLLIITGEFASEGRQLPAESRQRAAAALAQAEQALQRAREKQEFGRKAQKDLADRIRARRKDLEQVLQRAGEGPELEDS